MPASSPHRVPTAARSASVEKIDAPAPPCQAVTMCGRYAAFLPAEAVARLFRTVNPLPNVAASWNIAPTQSAMVVRRHPDTGQRHLDLLSWGLLPHWTKDPARAQRPINARAETVAKSGMFRGAFAQRRCIVPADAFYEWRAVACGKQPFAIARQDGQPMAFAGLWEGFKWPDGTVARTFTIVTTSASADVAGLHDRMPVILEQPGWPAWLGEAEGAIRLRCSTRPLKARCGFGPSVGRSTFPGTTRRTCWSLWRIRRCRPGCRRTLHQDEARPREVTDKPIRRDPRHHVVCIVDPLSPLIAQREGQGLGDFVRGGGAEVWRVGRGGTIGNGKESSKNLGISSRVVWPPLKPH